MIPANRSDAPPDYPPPSYSLPGQSPPDPKREKNIPNATAPPPPGLYAPPPPPPAVNQQSQSPIIIQAASTNFGPYPMRYTCPNCHAHVMTETNPTPGCLTYVLGGALCLLGCYCCCCFIPFCIRECKDIEHVCPSCGHKLGFFKRM